jgi:hypothetical protein
MEYILYMEWTVIFHHEFSPWFYDQDEELQDEIAANLKVLEEDGPMLGRPRVDAVKGSVFTNMKELRVQFQGDPYRILFAFDPKRQALLLVGGCKVSDKRWYKTNVPIADKRFKEHLQKLEKEKKK